MSGGKRLRAPVLSALFAAVLCIVSPWALPVGPVPVTLGIFALLLAGIVLSWKQAAAAAALYLLLGLMGLPVFSGAVGGLAVLAGPTGGYLWSYVPMAALVSYFGSGGRFRIMCVAAGTLILCYVLGTLQFVLLTGSGWREAVMLCVVPFLLFDAIKLVCAVEFGMKLRKRLRSEQLL